MEYVSGGGVEGALENADGVAVGLEIADVEKPRGMPMRWPDANCVMIR